MKRVFLAAMCVLFLCTPVSADDLSGLLPDNVGDLSRTQLLTGLAAQAEVDQLHGKALQAEASAVGRYARSGERPAEVWISRVESEAEARRQIGLMVHRMYENPKSPFRNPARLEHNGVAVYRFSGMGQVHLLWASGDLAWWVSAQPGDGQRLLDAFCR
ncbi:MULTISPECIES: hypothetical protein [unclassified Pseudodesulfovibrio]|uniref:hypothetical protein n=1 Tax=unclassified Pseudodesulfovibrio TaxID=2661612 RepID=UPI000FEC03AC|nr:MULTISPECIES: hypothetical protein [unclassified Pseudodesulfovibrio]MCJ2165223.1 hypothetical protein [Pseudodesulfovibrio sp. S3-i]RWU03277.1 hypothetical protein DWB63_11775 [Pseudodesulfovibrio sp. S3]